MYHGPWGKKGRIQQVAGTKKNYRTKNINGGRACTLGKAKGYGSRFMGNRKRWDRSMAYLYAQALERKRNAPPPTAEDLKFARSMEIILAQAAPNN